MVFQEFLKPQKLSNLIWKQKLSINFEQVVEQTMNDSAHT